MNNIYKHEIIHEDDACVRADVTNSVVPGVRGVVAVEDGAVKSRVSSSLSALVDAGLHQLTHRQVVQGLEGVRLQNDKRYNQCCLRKNQLKQSKI